MDKTLCIKGLCNEDKHKASFVEALHPYEIHRIIFHLSSIRTGHTMIYYRNVVV